MISFRTFGKVLKTMVAMRENDTLAGFHWDSVSFVPCSMATVARINPSR